MIFLISLPRSGSTLLQHILGSHSKIAASAEPWVLLPNLLTLKKGAFNAKYQPEIGRIALVDFLDQIDGGDQVYYDAVRKYSDHMYSSFLNKSGKTIYLDKTSRYYLALPELYKVYPDAKYIFLLRNPLSVLASFIENMVNGVLEGLARDGIREDLMEGYKILVDQISNQEIDGCTVQYESLIQGSESEVRRLCQFIGVDFEPEMLNYGGTKNVLQGKLVDPKSIHKHDSPVKDYLYTWQKVLDTNEKLTFASDYLNYLGRDVIQKAGYDFDELIQNCNHKETKGSVNHTFEKIMFQNQNLEKSANTIFDALRNKQYKLMVYRIFKRILKRN